MKYSMTMDSKGELAMPDGSSPGVSAVTSVTASDAGDYQVSSGHDAFGALSTGGLSSATRGNNFGAENHSGSGLGSSIGNVTNAGGAADTPARPSFARGNAFSSRAHRGIPQFDGGDDEPDFAPGDTPFPRADNAFSQLGSNDDTGFGSGGNPFSPADNAFSQYGSNNTGFTSGGTSLPRANNDFSQLGNIGSGSAQGSVRSPHAGTGFGQLAKNDNGFSQFGNIGSGFDRRGVSSSRAGNSFAPFDNNYNTFGRGGPFSRASNSFALRAASSSGPGNAFSQFGNNDIGLTPTQARSSFAGNSHTRANDDPFGVNNSSVRANQSFAPRNVALPRQGDHNIRGQAPDAPMMANAEPVNSLRSSNVGRISRGLSGVALEDPFWQGNATPGISRSTGNLADKGGEAFDLFSNHMSSSDDITQRISESTFKAFERSPNPSAEVTFVSKQKQPIKTGTGMFRASQYAPSSTTSFAQRLGNRSVTSANNRSATTSITRITMPDSPSPGSINEPARPQSGNFAREPRDRTVSLDRRLMNKNPQEVYHPEACVFAANLTTGRQDIELQAEVTKVMSEFGTVYVEIRRDGFHNNMPVAFCQFTETEHAERAIEEARGVIIFDRPLRTERANSSRWFAIHRRDRGNITYEEARAVMEVYGHLSHLSRLEDQMLLEMGIRDAIKVSYARFDSKRSTKMSRYPPKGYHIDLLGGKPKMTLEQRAGKYLDAYDECRRSIYVGDLPAVADEQNLVEYFSLFGLPKNVKIIVPPRGKAFGFVEFTSFHHVQEVLDNYIHHDFLGMFQLRVERKVQKKGGEIVGTQTARRIKSSQFDIAAASPWNQKRFQKTPARLATIAGSLAGSDAGQGSPRAQRVAAVTNVASGDTTAGAGAGPTMAAGHPSASPLPAPTPQRFGFWPGLAPDVTPSGNIHWALEGATPLRGITPARGTAVRRLPSGNLPAFGDRP